MYLVVIAWVYVVLLMSVAEATNSNGTLLGALVTFLLYGLLPVALVVYLMGTPARKKAIRQRENEEHATQMAAQQMAAPTPMHELAASPTPAETPASSSVEPDAGGHPSRCAETVAPDAGVTPMRKET